MLKKELLENLNKISKDLKTLRDDYFIIGSSGLVLAGVELILIDDLDILTSTNDAELLKILWKDYLIENPVTEDNDKFKSHFCQYYFDGIKIEIMGDLMVNFDNIWQRLFIDEFIEVELSDFSVKIPTLTEQERILRIFGRKKDLEKISLIKKL
jgi:hypothetical protein